MLARWPGRDSHCDFPGAQFLDRTPAWSIRHIGCRVGHDLSRASCASISEAFSRTRNNSPQRTQTNLGHSENPTLTQRSLQGESCIQNSKDGCRFAPILLHSQGCKSPIRIVLGRVCDQRQKHLRQLHRTHLAPATFGS